MAVGLMGGGDDEGDGVSLQAGHLTQVEDDIEVALGVDEVLQDGVDLSPVVGVDLTVDGDDDRATRPADAEV